MSAEVEAAVRDRVAQVVEDVAADEIDLDVDLADEYGLTSLNKVLLLTAVCDDTAVDLSNFTEHDLAAMRTARQIVTALSAHKERITHV
ncbi:phosphopantetheine-binding protein [Microtetraspora niveoalba]|uniref:phosphopantetheine-binding protein n=1 Tax=Microtetraspora niveoalba TaxID=46175 RepID=UPI000833AF3A|nr:phosphopantetheine-binding protein [Microtetraspora niveoalba]